MVILKSCVPLLLTYFLLTLQQVCIICFVTMGSLDPKTSLLGLGKLLGLCICETTVTYIPTL